MGDLDHTDSKSEQELSLTAIRIAEGAARSAEKSSVNAQKMMREAESSLQASEERMSEISAAAVVAAGEATEARMQVTALMQEFRALEARVAEHLRIDRPAAAVAAEQSAPESAQADPLTELHDLPPVPAPPEADADDIRIRMGARPEESSTDGPATDGSGLSDAVEPDASPTAEFESLRKSFDSKADRILERLKAIEPR